MTHDLRFILNDRDVRESIPPGLLVLDYLRRRVRATGTKEGCREGDCGACTILVGSLEEGRVVYRPVTSCLMPAGDMHGRHIVTIEGLSGPKLTPVQAAIVEEGATQCGFCTPGIVVSLTGGLLDPQGKTVHEALSGHLCRCTGYRSLKAAAQSVFEAAAGKSLEELIEGGHVPAYFRDIPERLRRMHAALPVNGHAGGKPVAGGTDLYVQQGDDLPDVEVAVLGLRPDLQGIRRDGEALVVGAGTTFEAFGDHPEVRRLIPDIPEYLRLIASWQIRNRATLGGNIVNASPIGDLSILLLALDATLTLRGGETHREVPLRSFFLGYKQRDLREGELVEVIRIPLPPEGTRVHFEKVSKRTCLDIASVNAGLVVRAEGGRLAACALALGGVAPVPLYLPRTSAFLTGKPLSPGTLLEAVEGMQEEIAPIDDIRGSAAYKRLLARQLVLAAFVRLFPEQIEARALYEPS